MSNQNRNYVVVSGTVEKLPDAVNYIPRPLVSFDLRCFRKKKASEEEHERQSDIFTVVLFDKENFLDEIQEGDRVLVKGEVQTRNFTTPFTVTEEYVINAVRNYYEVFDEFPTQRPLEGRRRVPISFKKLFDEDFIPRLPQDSLYNEEDIKEKSEERYYMYTVDESGDVYKEIQRTAYEILTDNFEKLEEPLPPKGDVNFVELWGTPVPPYNFTFRGEENPVPFLSFKVKTKSRFFKDDDRYFYVPVISWGKLAETHEDSITEHNFVRVKGRMQTRSYEKKIRVRWFTEFGNKKHKDKMIEHVVREASASLIDYTPAPPPPKRKKRNQKHSSNEPKKP